LRGYNGQAFAVDGLSWMDHEFSTSALLMVLDLWEFPW